MVLCWRAQENRSSSFSSIFPPSYPQSFLYVPSSKELLFILLLVISQFNRSPSSCLSVTLQLSVFNRSLFSLCRPPLALLTCCTPTFSTFVLPSLPRLIPSLSLPYYFVLHPRFFFIHFVSIHTTVLQFCFHFFYILLLLILFVPCFYLPHLSDICLLATPLPPVKKRKNRTK